MTLHQYQIKYEHHQVCFYFIENLNTNSLLKLNIVQQKHLFGQSLANECSLNNTNSHGVSLKNSDLKKIASFFVDSVQTKDGVINDLKIKNNKVTAYFFTLAEIGEFNKQTNDFQSRKQINLWEFTSSNSTISRELWVEKNELQLKNCCLRNFLLQDRLKTPNVENITEYAENFCVFPKYFVDVNVLGYTYLSHSNEKINTNEANKEKTENDISIKAGFSVKYLYSSLKKEKKQIKPREIITLLDIFNDNSIFNLNCCDLFSCIRENDSTFYEFIYNCLVTLIFQQARAADKEEKKMNNSYLWSPGLEFNLLCCCLVFD